MTSYPEMSIPSLGARRRIPISTESQMAIIESEGAAYYGHTSPTNSLETDEELKNQEKQRPQSSNEPRRVRRPEERESVSEEALSRLKTDLDELALFLQQESKRNVAGDPVRAYARRLADPSSIKLYSSAAFGYKILGETRTAKEQLEIDRSNYEILKFAYMESSANGCSPSSTLDTEIIAGIRHFIGEHAKTDFRSGAFSVAIDFDNFPPGLTARATFPDNETALLRPVVVDGVAVMFSASNGIHRPFYQSSVATEQIPYSHDLILQVKPLFDIVVSFLIRGHKTRIYLPKYYQKYVTKGKLSKVDDVVAFRKLIKLDFVEFLEAKFRQHGRKWFNAVSEVADSKEAVFISSMDYRPPGECKYQKPSERIITPCFLNTEDRLMVINPVVRYRIGDKKFVMIPAEEILTHKRGGHDFSTQLYLQDQIRLLCELCQLYPMKSLNAVSIKQLLHLVVTAESDLPMPHMTVDDLRRLERVFNTGSDEH